jgi:hypothetical protein
MTGTFNLPINLSLEIDQICCEDNPHTNDERGRGFNARFEVQNEMTTTRKILGFFHGI